MADVNPEPRTIDEQMDRPTRREPTKSNLTESLEPPRQRRVIGNRDLQVQHLSQGTKEALGLPEREEKDHADRQGRLDRDVRVGALAGRFSAGCCPSRLECVIGEPDCEVATVLELGLVFSPIPHPISRLRVLVLATLRILHR